MSGQRERELKLRLLGEEDHRRLIAARVLSPAGPPRLQENHYFDTADLRLARAGAMLRLRQEERLLMTFKQGKERRGAPGYFDALEVEAEVPVELLAAARERPTRLLEVGVPPAVEVRRRFGSPPLEYLGALRNERLCLWGGPPSGARHLLEVDRVAFPAGDEVYEVEIETDDPEGARAWIEGLLGSLGARAVPQRLTKLQELLSRRGARLP